MSIGMEYVVRKKTRRKVAMGSWMVLEWAMEMVSRMSLIKWSMKSSY